MILKYIFFLYKTTLAITKAVINTISRIKRINGPLRISKIKIDIKVVNITPKANKTSNKIVNTSCFFCISKMLSQSNAK